MSLDSTSSAGNPGTATSSDGPNSTSSPTSNSRAESPTTSGVPESLRARLAESDGELDRFEHSLGLPLAPPLAMESEATRLLSLEPSALRAMSQVELAEGNFLLEQFAFHLQRAANRETGRLTWSSENLRRVLAPLLARQPGLSAEERRLAAVLQSPAARELEKMRVDAQRRLDRIAYLSTKVSALAGAMLQLHYAKRKSDG